MEAQKHEELVAWTRYILDLLNVTYQVSNHGKEIRFRSKFTKSDTRYKGFDVKLYPTTGTYQYHTHTFKPSSPNPRNVSSIVNNIKKCIAYHVNDYAFKGLDDG